MHFTHRITLQDEIISDEECEVDSRSDAEEESNNTAGLGDIQQQLNQQPLPFYNSTTASTIQGSLPQVPPSQHHHTQALSHVMQPQSASALNGAIHHDDLNVLSGQVPPQLPAQGLNTQISGVSVPHSLQIEDCKPIEENITEPTVDLSFNDQAPETCVQENIRETG